MIETNKPVSSAGNSKTPKSRKYTVLFTAGFFLLAGISFLGLLAPIAADVDSLDASRAVALDHFVDEQEGAFFLWRLCLYFTLLGVFYLWGKTQEKARADSKKYFKFDVVRIGLYLIMFELFIVQNTLNKLFSAILNG